MKALPTLASALILVAFAASAEEPWRAVTRQCDEVAEQTFCVGKAGCPNWEWLTACTAQNYFRDQPVAISETNYRLCVSRVNAKRTQQRACASCGDPVAEVFGCLLGQ